MYSPGEPEKVGILNLSSHVNFLSDLSKIALSKYEVEVFTTPSIKERVKDDVSSRPRLEWSVKKESDSKRDYLRHVEQRTAADVDILLAFPFYGNIFDFRHYAQFSPNCPYIQIAYEINGWAGERPAATSEFYNFAKYPLKRWMLRRIDILLVEFDTIQEYARSRLPETNIETFTPVISNHHDTTTGRTRDHSEIVITVPGMIDRTRRNYNLLLEAITKLPQAHAASIEVVLLGTPQGKYGEKILRRAEELKEVGKVTYFRDWIPEAAFEHHLRRSDILVSPLRQTRQVNGFVEEYGLSKGSGAISDAIRQSTPLLLPEWFKVPERVEPAIQTFCGVNGLSNELYRVISNEEYFSDLRDGANRMSEQYTIPEQQKRLSKLVQDLI
ncbi:glycosyltransferase family 4 protein [Salarchaeum sp. JOR-1]|uniref:glycosyltransferase family 4 protein n=1 Tax=Salarchaeum sp. JOR-1 TaxID=2599399 RepID=UPI0011988862|nr:glycosyltransferase family 4 protein [Salarchaeum sp. JOR-1]QDX40825.1 glycosyltransferase family 4 protein [Salarchaeum sp. JOR-1]